MKKLFTFFAATVAMLSVQAKDYTCLLNVSLDGTVVSSEKTTVSVDEQTDGAYTLSLKNFSLGGFINVGNIVVNNVEAIPCGVVTAIKSAQTIQIAAGDDATVDWMGPALGDVPITLLGELKGNDIKAVLNISFGGMAIGVQLGEGTESLGQLPNAGFNAYHTATYQSNTSDEPNGWHSFMSSTGSLASSVSSKVHTFVVDEGCPTSTDNKSVQIKSTSVLSMFSANGTITTGRLNAGSMTATSDDNNSFSNLENTDVDGNGDPFYAVLTTKPDSIKTWLKYKVGARKSSNKNAYATISAIINDGTQVQDPDSKGKYAASYVATAQNAEIASNGEAWQEVSIPFAYTSNDVQPKAILVTMSTCSVASGGSVSDSDPDILTVDSVALIYNCKLTSLKFKDQTIAFDDYGQATLNVTGSYTADDFAVTTDGVGAIVSKLFSQESDDADPVLMITVTAGDLKSANSYYVTIKGGDGPTSISHTPTVNNAKPQSYNVAGQRVNAGTKGLTIVRKADGSVVKMLMK